MTEPRAALVRHEARETRVFAIPAQQFVQPGNTTSQILRDAPDIGASSAALSQQRADRFKSVMSRTPESLRNLRNIGAVNPLSWSGSGGLI
jgi:hypothetical protein